MRVLFVHNRYALEGGEDVVVAVESCALRASGHDVEVYSPSSTALKEAGTPAIGAALWDFVRPGPPVPELHRLLSLWRPEVVYAHNLFPLVPPSLYAAAHGCGAAVVQVLHNFRLSCPVGSFLRDGKPCFECRGGLPWPAVRHACREGSYLQSAAYALATRRQRSLAVQGVDLYAAVSGFLRESMVRGGLLARRVVVKENFIDPDPGLGAGDGDYALYVGRLSPEKGLRSLLRAWSEGDIGGRLDVAGAGPLAGELAAAEQSGAIRALGRLERTALAGTLSRARFVVFPSEWDEGCPLAVLESLAAGVPVVATAVGGLPDFVQDGVAGLIVPRGDRAALARACRLLWRDRALRDRLSLGARAAFERRFTARIGVKALESVFAQALELRAQCPPG